jgi:hypothetical protein
VTTYRRVNPMKIYEMMATLKEETGPKRALTFLNENTECHRTIKYLLDPYVRTGLGKLELHGKPNGMKDPDELTIELLDYFSGCGKDGGRIAKESFATKAYLNGPDNDEWKWFVELIAAHGHTAFGVGWSTAKKAGIEVAGFGCQLGVKLSDVGSDMWLHTNGERMQRWRISEKIDGTRRLFIKRNGQVECFSRSGREDGTLMHINSVFLSDNFPTNRIYDCEVVDSKYFGKVDSFEVRAKSVGKAARKGGDKRSLIAICFDFYDFDRPELTTINRTRELKEIFKDTKQSSPVQIVKMFGRMDGYESQKLDDILASVLDAGGEGLMLQELSSQYVFERTSNLIKVKRLEEHLGRIVGRHMGRPGTRLEGKVAAIVCEVEGCTQWVRVGTGLSDLDREIFTEHYEELEGAEVEIEAFSKTVSKGGKTSLCFPVFKRCKHKLFEECE